MDVGEGGGRGAQNKSASGGEDTDVEGVDSAVWVGFNTKCRKTPPVVLGIPIDHGRAVTVTVKVTDCHSLNIGAMARCASIIDGNTTYKYLGREIGWHCPPPFCSFFCLD